MFTTTAAFAPADLCLPGAAAVAASVAAGAATAVAASALAAAFDGVRS